IEGAIEWSSPGDWVVLAGNGTGQNVINTSTDGEFGSFAGQRIPNRPWAFANWSGRFQWRAVLRRQDELSTFYFGRYVHEFYQTWENFGDKRFKPLVPTQVSHAIGLTYSISGPMRSSATLQIDNLTDAQLYDFFRVQRPGRSVSLKI